MRLQCSAVKKVEFNGKYFPFLLKHLTHLPNFVCLMVILQAHSLVKLLGYKRSSIICPPQDNLVLFFRKDMGINIVEVLGAPHTEKAAWSCLGQVQDGCWGTALFAEGEVITTCCKILYTLCTHFMWLLYQHCSHCTVQVALWSLW